MSVENPIYKIKNLKHAYNGRPVLEIDDFSVERNSIVGLMGPNGSGKSTLLRFMAFIEVPANGEILYNGKIEYPFSDAVKSHVTLLPQTPYLMKRSVLKNVVYGLTLNKAVPKSDIGHRVREALGMVGLDENNFANRQWHELSGGETQRVALAARLALRPDALLLDEPTASVDAASVQRIKEAAIQARREWGTTIVIAGHDRQWLLDVCDRTVHLFNGRIFDSAYENILFGPWMPRQDGLWEKSSENHQRISVSKPPHPEATAAIDPRHIDIHDETDAAPPDRPWLTGTISQLTLEKNGNRLLVSVRVGGLCLAVLVSGSEAERRKFFPGRMVRLAYDPALIRWI